MSSYFTLLLVLLLGGIVSVIAAVVVMALSLLRPPRMTDVKALWVLRRVSPLDVGLAYEEMDFAVRDEPSGGRLRIAGWWIPHPTAQGRCVVMLHGYADAKIGAMAWGPLWHRLGFNILAIDLRAHGYSGGTFSTAGCRERYDVSQVIDQLRTARPGDSRQIALFGVSLGAAVAAATAALRDDVSIVVLDSPYARFESTAIAHMHRLGASGPLLGRAALCLAKKIADVDFSDVRLDPLLASIAAPVAVIGAADDELLSAADRAEIAAAMDKRKSSGNQRDQYWLADRADHLSVLYTNPQEYEQRLAAFIERALAVPSKVES
ncbi:MAG TPA: alpha/beta fold hydrolase [Humisphaera sp.]|nr:alpha/beta fold hydrolase [Humisphaera sp.]